MSQIFVSVNNSTTTPLGASASFTGVADALQSWNEIDLTVFGSPSNASGVLYFEFSRDGSIWDVSVPLVLAGLATAVPVPLRSVLPFFRVRYINGPVAQTAFRLTSVFHRAGAIRLTRFLSQAIDPNEPVDITRSVTDFQATDGTFQHVSSTQPLPVSDAAVVAQLQTLNALTPSAYDYISLGYTGSNLTTVVYKSGGAAGTVVSTLTLAYSGSLLVSVTKS